MTAQAEYSDPAKAEVYKDEHGWRAWCGPCDRHLNSMGRPGVGAWFETWSAAMASLGLHAKNFHHKESL